MRYPQERIIQTRAFLTSDGNRISCVFTKRNQFSSHNHVILIFRIRIRSRFRAGVKVKDRIKVGVPFPFSKVEGYGWKSLPQMIQPKK